MAYNVGYCGGYIVLFHIQPYWTNEPVLQQRYRKIKFKPDSLSVLGMFELRDYSSKGKANNVWQVETGLEAIITKRLHRNIDMNFTPMEKKMSCTSTVKVVENNDIKKQLLIC